MRWPAPPVEQAISKLRLAKPAAMSPAPQVPSLPKDPAAARPALPAPSRSPPPLPAAIRCALVAVIKAVRARALLVVRALSRSAQARRAALASARVVLTLTLALRLVPLVPRPRRTLRPEHRHRSAICSAPPRRTTSTSMRRRPALPAPAASSVTPSDARNARPAARERLRAPTKRAAIHVTKASMLRTTVLARTVRAANMHPCLSTASV